MMDRMFLSQLWLEHSLWECRSYAVLDCSLNSNGGPATPSHTQSPDVANAATIQAHDAEKPLQTGNKCLLFKDKAQPSETDQAGRVDSGLEAPASQAATENLYGSLHSALNGKRCALY